MNLKQFVASGALECEAYDTGATRLRRRANNTTPINATTIAAQQSRPLDVIWRALLPSSRMIQMLPLASW